MTACTSTGRPWSCALATALPGVLTDSARLGSARHTVRRSAAQTRRGEMRRGRLPSHDYRTTDPSVAARALRLVRERLRPTSYTYASCRFHGGLGLLFSPFLSSFFFYSFSLCFFHPLFHPPLRDLSYFFGNAPRSTSKQTIRLARFAYDSSDSFFALFESYESCHDRILPISLDRLTKISRNGLNRFITSRCTATHFVIVLIAEHRFIVFDRHSS